MKTIMFFTFLAIFNLEAYATDYHCNLQIFTKEMIVSGENDKDFIKIFTFKTPLQQNYLKSLKYLHLKIFKSKKEDKSKKVYLNLKNTRQNIEVATDYLDGREIISLTLMKDTIICWSKKAMNSAQKKRP